MKNLINKKWIGDLSLQDADVLVEYANKSSSILEFGVGGSTQLFAQCGGEELLSIDTSTGWIGLTEKRLNQFEAAREVRFCEYNDWKTIATSKYDLIFVDGVEPLRLEFASESWNLLREGGIMIFHDTFRTIDIHNCTTIIQLFFNEISRIDINAAAQNGKSSNLSIIHKKESQLYEDWNYTENKPLWAYGDDFTRLDLWEYSTT
tara:strand:- start:45 stop:659 length:615 start_codon:yes stop_codon:yes gene_type:complete